MATGEPKPGRRRRPRSSLAWFGGADLNILARAPSERSFYSALGAAVLVLACAGGTTMAFAVSYMLDVPAARLWWLGVAWALFIACAIERLVLQVSASRKRWLPVVLLPRILVSFLLAVQFGEPLWLRINEDAINDHLSLTQRQATQKALTQAKSFYEPRITSAREEIAGIRLRRDDLRERAELFRFRSDCEADSPSCSSTAKRGCGAYCRHYARVSERTRLSLKSSLPHDRERLRALKAEVRNLQLAYADDVRDRRRRIADNDGLIAREEALAALARAHPAVAAEIWFLRAFFLILDLLPLAAKVLRILTIDSPYEEIAAAARRADAVTAAEIDAAARVQQNRVEKQRDADIQKDTIEIQLDTDKRIDEAEAMFEAGTHGATRRSTGRSPVPGWSLAEYVDRMEPHEARPVPVPPDLRRGGLVGFGLIAALAVGSGLWSLISQRPVAGGWLLLLSTALAAAVAVYTRGFRSAPGWALRATFVTLVVGLTLPLLIIGINV